MKITVTYLINEASTNKKHVIAVFYSADDLLYYIDCLKQNGLYIENMMLYKYNKKYIIIFPSYFPACKRMFCLKEFGKIKFVCENTVSHIKEYGVLINDNLKSLLK